MVDENAVSLGCDVERHAFVCLLRAGTPVTVPNTDDLSILDICAKLSMDALSENIRD